MLRYTTDRARPGLVALYDIRPGNGAGQFLQPRSPHGATAAAIQTERKHTNLVSKVTSRTTWVRQYQNLSILQLIGAKDDGGGGDN